jgi:hypothetical protein
VHDGTRKCTMRAEFGRVWSVQPDGYREYTSRFREGLKASERVLRTAALAILSQAPDQRVACERALNGFHKCLSARKANPSGAKARVFIGSGRHG